MTTGTEVKTSTAKLRACAGARRVLSAGVCVTAILAICCGTASAETEYLVKSENLKDLTSVPSALENLGLVRSSSNTVLGKEAFSANLSGKENSIFGFKAMESSTTAEEDTAIGYEALATSSGADKDTAVGHASMYSTTSGDNDVAIGNNTLFYATTASENTAVGNSALEGFYKEPITGKRNTAVGREAGAAISSGERNTDIGFNADDENKTGSENTAVGTDALGSPTTKAFSTSRDTALGMNAGLHVEGDGNVFLGWEAGAAAKSISNMLYIDNSPTEEPLILGNFETNVLKVDGKLEVSETAAAPAKPTEGEVNTGTTKVVVRKTSFTITGNNVKTKWSLKHGLATRLVSVSIQKAEAEQPGELESPSAYKVKPTNNAEVEVTFNVAPAAGEEKFITVEG
jgi:hypothetical protein